MKGKFRILGNIGLALFLACALMLAVVPATEVEAATAVTEVWVEFPALAADGSTAVTTYNVAAAVGLYRIHFKATTALVRAVDTITIQFPDGVDTTMGPSDNPFTVGTACSTAGNFDIDPDGPGTTYTSYYDCTSAAFGGKRITVTIPCDIAAGSEAWLMIDDADNMVTGGAQSTTAYKVKVHTSKDTTPVLSKGFYLGTGGSKVATTASSISPTEAGATNVEYIFTFTPNDALEVADTITVTFPYGTTVPSSIAASSITVYDPSGSPAWYTCGVSPTIDTDLRTVKITVPHVITADTGAKIKFATACGITNPTRAYDSWGAVTTKARVGFIRTSDGMQDTPLSAYEVTHAAATKVDFDYTASPDLVTGQSDKYTMINMYSSPLYLQVEDQYGNVVSTGTDATVYITLTTSSATGVFYYDSDESSTADGAYTQISVTQQLTAGKMNIYYKDTNAGIYTLTASYSGLTSCTWTMQVCPAASLYDRYDNLIDNYAPTNTTPVEETDATTTSGCYKGGYYVDNAIDAATSYDKVVLGDGHYEVDASTNKVMVDEAYITLKSLNGADYTTIDSRAGADQILDVTAANVTIEDLTIQGIKTTTSCRGIYLRYSGCTIQNNKFIDIPNDNIFMESGAGAITSGTIDSNTVTGIGQASEQNRGGIHIAASDAANTYDISGVNITNNTISGFSRYGNNGIKLAGSRDADNVGLATATITGNTISDCHYGLYLRGDLSATLMGGTKAIASNTISGCYAGVCLRWGNAAAFTMVKNTITNNTKYGIYLSDTGDALTAAKNIYYNDISGNGTWGILNYFASVTTAPVCKYNWYGDATGPGAGTGTWASTTAQGSGDAVSKNVTFSPWLHKSLADVIADNASYQAVNMKVVAGWNTLSTPVQLIAAADTIDELIPSGMTIGYYYDEGWQQITTGYTLSPCDAVYVKMSAITYVLLKFDAGAFTTPSKDLKAGWNLASLAHLNYTSASDAMNADDAVASVAKTPANLPGYSQVVSPSLNGNQTDIYGLSGTSWAVAYGQDTVVNKMYAGLGYWVYMQNAATLAGFEITPIVPDFTP